MQFTSFGHNLLFFRLPSSNLLLINFLSKLVLFFFCKKIKKVTCLVIYLENITYTCCCIYSLAQTFFKRVFLGSCVSRISNFACTLC